MASEESPAEGDTGSSLLLNQPVVIDNGTATLKAGFAGSAKPKVWSKGEMSASLQTSLAGARGELQRV
jgi:hypothetical protein